MKILGYRRENGQFGIRNHLAIIPTSVCASETARRIAALIPGAVALAHSNGCCQIGADFEQTLRTLAGLGKNPNVAAVLIVGLGCDGLQAQQIYEEVKTIGKPVEQVIIQESGGTLGAIEKGAEIARGFAAQISQQEKVEADISELCVALECGGSDPTSGISANPTIGNASDKIIALGGRTVLSETTEMIGAEHILQRRARTPEIGQRFIEMVQRVENRSLAMGVDLRGTQPTPGNIEGGLTTIEEKSLGCIYKAGTAPLEDVLEYGETIPDHPGLYFMDTPGQDIDSITGMTAGGAQIVLFSTGRGTPTGCPVAPVIKITGNPDTYEKMRGNIDINAGRAISEGIPLDQLGDELLQEIVEVSRGKLTKAESLGHNEFGIYRISYTF